MMSLGERFRNSWNAFLGRDPTLYGPGGYSSRPDRARYRFVNLRSILSVIYTHIALDVSSVNILHARSNDQGQYTETINDSLNVCLSLSANLNQTGREMIRDAVLTLFDEGAVAIVPVDTDKDPATTDSYNIYSLQVGRILEWMPYHVRVRIFNNAKQQFEEAVVEKRYTVIVENPFYSIMNEPNSTMQRLKRTIQSLDKINDSINPNKMDLIIQLPYSTRATVRKKEAEQRRSELEKQMTDSQYGIGYIDASEKIIQLNRSIENNLWTQVSELQADLYNQMGFSQKIFDGTASETETLNYYTRTVEPILSAITEDMTRKWLTKTAITQGQSIRYFRDPFKLVPVNNIAEIADKFTRNEIMTSNEIRSVIGFKPSNDPKADQLINSNLNHPEEKTATVEKKETDQQFQNES